MRRRYDGDIWKWIFLTFAFDMNIYGMRKLQFWWLLPIFISVSILGWISFLFASFFKIIMSFLGQSSSIKPYEPKMLITKKYQRMFTQFIAIITLNTLMFLFSSINSLKELTTFHPLVSSPKASIYTQTCSSPIHTAHK